MIMTLDQLKELISSTNLTLEESLDNSKSHFRIGTDYYDPKETILFSSFRNVNMRLLDSKQSKSMKKISSRKRSDVIETSVVKNNRTNKKPIDFISVNFVEHGAKFVEELNSSNKNNKAKLSKGTVLTVA
ncbi:hypothetical protein ABZM74_001024 [Weissella confusa]